MSIRVDRRLYLTADRKDVVEEGDPRAAWLLVAEGDELNDEEAREYGLLDPEPQATPGDDPGPEAKQSKPAGTKVRYPGDTKRRK